jgi:PAS domain S-box-containing protein
MSPKARQILIRYALAPVLVILIVLFKLLIATFIPDQQSFLLFFAAITLTTWYGGIGPGLISSALSAVFANYFFFPPIGAFNLTSTVLFQITLFFLESLFVVGLANALRDRRTAQPQAVTIRPSTVPRQENALALLDTFEVYAPVGLAFLDNDLRYIRINYAMAEANGMTPAVYVGKLLEEMQPGLTPEVIAQIRQVAATGTPLLDQEMTVTKPTMLGMKQQHFSTSYYRIRGADGKSLGIGAVMIDMTQSKEAEAILRESETRFRMMADTAPVMIWLADADKKRTYFNKGWLDFTGRTMDEEVGSGWQANVHPDDLTAFLQKYDEAFEKHTPYRMEYRLKRFDEEYRWILATGVPRYVSDGDGRFDGFIGTCFDIHERRQLEIGQEFLTQAGEILASSLDYETTLANVAKLAVPTIADWCAVDILTPEGKVERLAVAHVDPEKVKWAYELQERYPLDMDAPTGLAQVLRTGELAFLPLITEAMIEGAARDAEMYQILREIGFTSAIIAPLIVRERTLGALTLVTTESRRHFTETDVTLAEQLATRAALAVDNARLYREAQRSSSTPD